jgi:hypothetical protein
MRRIAAIGLVLLAAVAWLVVSATQQSAERHLTVPEASPTSTPPSVEPELSNGSLGELAVAQQTSIPEDRSPVATPAAQVPDGPRCTILGRAIDAVGSGIAAATVRLAAYPRWSDDADVPTLPGKWKLQGFEVRTDENGTFRIEAPMPTFPVSFMLTPDEYHDLVRRRYGGTQQGDLPPFHLGENDLGTFSLASTGALSGFVRDDQGAPIAGARVRLGPAPSLTEEREVETDTSGRYVIGHASAGTHGVNAEANGFQSRFFKPFEVRRNETTLGPDFALAVAPTLRGRVLNEDGLPLGNARLWGWPASSGAGAGATSDADGSFVIYLPQDEPYTLEVKLDGYEPFGENDHSTHYKPGTQDIVCVLKKDVTTAFVIIDAESGTPVTRFAIRIIRDKGKASTKNNNWWSEWVPQLREHPGGELVIGARPGLDRFEIAAVDHARQEGEIEHESPSSNRQVIRLGRGTALVGRVVREGVPVADAGVKIERGSMDSGQKDEQGPHFRANSGEAHFGITNPQGEFRIAGLDSGDHRVTVTSGRAAPLVLVPVRIGVQSIQNLGTLNMLAGGTIRGVVRMEAGRSATGLQVFLDDERGGPTTSVDANGQFQFEEVSAGMHEMNAKELPGILADGPPLRVEVAAGQLKEIVLDLSGRGMCAVGVRVILNGTPTQDVNVVCDSAVANGKEESIGNTGADGWARSSIHAAGGTRLIALAQDGTPLGIDPEPMTLVSGGSIERVLELRTTSLEIEWPSDGVVPIDEPVNVVLTEVGAGQRPYWIHGNATPGPEGTGSNHCILPTCGPGEYEVKLHQFKQSGGPSEGQWIQYTGRTIVRAGDPGRVVLQKDAGD